MSILALGYSFEKKLSFLDIKKYIGSIKQQFTPGNDRVKSMLKEIEEDIQRETQVLTDIKNLNQAELEILFQKINKFNIEFDKLNSSYYDKNYDGDGELKQLFSTISRQASRIENFSRKYLLRDTERKATPEYIKEGLAEFSKQTLAKKI